jgi:hypothetical protein
MKLMVIQVHYNSTRVCCCASSLSSSIWARTAASNSLSSSVVKFFHIEKYGHGGLFPLLSRVPVFRKLLAVACCAAIGWILITRTYVWQSWKPSLSICCTMFQHWINAECFPASQLCVNTLPATKITLITDGI